MLMYDNCKNCVSKCEHAGKDREFVCGPRGSCKVECNAEKAAMDFVEAIKVIAQKPQNLDNLQSYLSTHFMSWTKKYANSPESLAAELQIFANMEI